MKENMKGITFISIIIALTELVKLYKELKEFFK